MAGLDEDEARKLFEQLGEDQRGAGVARLAEAVALFRMKLVEQGFEHQESFDMSRDFLNELMAHVGIPDADDD